MSLANLSAGDMAERPEQVDGHPYMLGSDYTADDGLGDDGRFAYTYDAEDRFVPATSRALANGAVRVRNEYDRRSHGLQIPNSSRR